MNTTAHALSHFQARTPTHTAIGSKKRSRISIFSMSGIFGEFKQMAIKNQIPATMLK
jgi:hypothetical protein